MVWYNHFGKLPTTYGKEGKAKVRVEVRGVSCSSYCLVSTTGQSVATLYAKLLRVGKHPSKSSSPNSNVGFGKLQELILQKNL